MVTRGTSASVRADEGWTVADRVMEADLDDWKGGERQGSRRDTKVLPVVRDVREHRHVSLRDAIVAMKRVRSSGEELALYHDALVRCSSVHAGASIAHNHRALISVLAHLVNFDHLNAHPGAVCCFRCIVWSVAVCVCVVSVPSRAVPSRASVVCGVKPLARVFNTCGAATTSLDSCAHDSGWLKSTRLGGTFLRLEKRHRLCPVDLQGKVTLHLLVSEETSKKLPGGGSGGKA